MAGWQQKAVFLFHNKLLLAFGIQLSAKTFHGSLPAACPLSVTFWLDCSRLPYHHTRAGYPNYPLDK
jgi:hypothetical protein